jgi:hypothetical protein
MPLVTPFDASFWSTEEKKQTKTPEQIDAEKIAKQNLALNGSATVENRWDPYGQKEYFSSLTGNTYTSPEAARADEALFQQLGPGGWAAKKDLDRSMTPATGQQTTPTNPNADTNAILDSIDPGAPPPPPTPAVPRADTIRAGFTQETPVATPGAPYTRARTITNAPVTVPGFEGPHTPTKTALTDAMGVPGTPTAPPEPGAQAPDIHRDKIDEILGGLSGYEQNIMDLAGDNTGLSVAEAQLMKADAMAKIRARDELAANQAGALGAARSARNRGDRALLERQAVGEQAYLGSQKQRQDVLQQAELEGNLSILRATESEHDRQFKLDALKEAAGLGLNRAALEVDIGKADLASATNWINNEAAAARQNSALDEQQYEALLDFSTKHTGQLLEFTKAMAGIQFEYDKLGVDDQNEADRLLMQKYGIDQGTMVALKQIKQAGKFKWDEFLAKMVAGGVTAATAAATGGTSLAIPAAAAAAGTGFDNSASTLYDPNAK